MRRTSLTLALTLISLSAITFERTYGRAGIDEWAEAVWSTRDGGYIIGGTTDTLRTPNPYLIRIDSVGDIVWDKIYTYSRCQTVRSLIVPFAHPRGVQSLEGINRSFRL